MALSSPGPTQLAFDRLTLQTWKEGSHPNSRGRVFAISVSVGITPNGGNFGHPRLCLSLDPIMKGEAYSREQRQKGIHQLVRADRIKSSEVNLLV